jgi:hypothetical protein
VARRPKISLGLRALVWNTYIGEQTGIWRCMCGSNVSQLNFECGHVTPVSQGGETTLENLRPVCSRCNKSMGTKNLFDYVASLGQRPEDLYLGDRYIPLRLQPTPQLFMSLAEGVLSDTILHLSQHLVAKEVLPPPPKKNTSIVRRSSRMWPSISGVGRGVWWTLKTTWWAMGKIVKMVTPKR